MTSRARSSAPRATTGAASGKVILLGEHAAVYGHPVLAGALGRGVTATVRHADADRLVCPAWDLAAVASDLDPARPAGHSAGTPLRALATLRGALGLAAPVDAEIEASLPARAGLGSSAALSVALARALARLAGRTPTDALVAGAADQAERVFHGNPSGVDVALAVAGGVGIFRRGQGLASLAAAPFRLAIGLSGVPRDTAARVAAVARRREAAPAETDRLLGELGDLALAGADALVAGQPLALGPLLDRAHERLATLGVSTPELDRLADVARRAGAGGAKLTGAGGGGAVIAVGAEDAVVEAWRTAGFDAFVVDVGVTAGDTA